MSYSEMEFEVNNFVVLNEVLDSKVDISEKDVDPEQYLNLPTGV
jgi:hypothetical protein